MGLHLSVLFTTSLVHIRVRLVMSSEYLKQGCSEQGRFPCDCTCRAAWYNDIEWLKELLVGIARPQLKALDPQGNSVRS